MNESIITAIMDHFATASGLPPILYPNVSATTPTGEHLIVDVLSAPTVSIGITDASQARGIINVTIRTPEGIGPIRANQIADAVLARFARNTALTSGGVTVRIDRLGYVSPPLGNAGGWYRLPLTIPYNAILP